MASGDPPAGVGRPVRFRLPQPLRWPLYAAWAVAALTALLAIGVSFAGYDDHLSPGALSSAHAAVDGRCVQCHDPQRGVVNLRCERCHDPADRGVMAHSAHIAGASRTGADATRTVTCVTCHTDHHGRDVPPARVDDHRCALCHQFNRLDAHPEFAIVRAGGAPAAGLKFTHDRHLTEAAKTGRRCESCHEPTADRRGFAPLSFARHCAACHLKGGALLDKTDPVAREMLLPLTEGSSTPQLVPGPRGLVEVVGVLHRDPWLLRNAARLERAIDPEAAVLRRTRLIRALLVEERQLLPPPVRGSLDALQSDARRVDDEISALEASLSDPGGEDAARQRKLGELAASVRALAGRIGQSQPTIAERVVAMLDADVPATDTGATLPARIDRRRDLLLDLLASIAARRPDLAATAAQLRTSVEQLPPPRDGDQPELDRRLTELDAMIARLVTVPESREATGLEPLMLQRDAARQAVAVGGAPIGVLEWRQWQLLRALDAIEALGGQEVTAQAGEIRRQVVSLDFLTPQATQLRIGDLKRGRDRLRLEIELRGAGESHGPSVTPPPRDRIAIERSVAELKQQLVNGESGDPTTAGIDPQGARASLSALLAPCLKCHEPADTGSLARVTAPRSELRHSIFNHAPHVLQADCQSCHSTIATSHTAHDVNVPSVATCRTCHGPSRASAGCGTCHRYHPTRPGGEERGFSDGLSGSVLTGANPEAAMPIPRPLPSGSRRE